MAKRSYGLSKIYTFFKCVGRP